MPLPSDSKQLEALVNRLRCFVRRNLRIADEHVVDDLAQEALLRLLRLDRPIDNFESYGMTVVRNCAIEQFRRQSRCSALDLGFEHSDRGQAAHDLESARELEAVGPELLRFVRSLDAVDSILLESALEGVSVRQAHADQLADQVGYNVACNRRRALLARLRRVLEDGRAGQVSSRRGRSSKSQLQLRDRLLELMFMAHRTPTRTFASVN